MACSTAWRAALLRPPPLSTIYRRSPSRRLTSKLCCSGWSKHIFLVRSFKEPRWIIAADEDGAACLLEDASSSIDEESALALDDGTQLYVAQLVTSDARGSGFSEANASLRFGLIGKDGTTILKRVITSESQSEALGCQSFRLQRGDVSAFKFLGPDIGEVEALWIAPVTGTWRVAEVRLSVVSSRRRVAYVFRGSEAKLLGDKGDATAAELRPVMLFSEGFTSAERQKLDDSSFKARQAGMEEYEVLKTKLLVADALLVALGTAGLLLAGRTNAASGFGLGGLGGLLYLYLLERTVDDISQQQQQKNSSSFWSPLSRVGVVIAVGLALVKALDAPLTREQVVAAAGGFLVYRLSVLLAAK